MKTIVEYLINNHIRNNDLSLNDICDIFNGNLTVAKKIKSCSLIQGAFLWENENHKWTICDGQMIIVYLNDEMSLDPDYIIKSWSGTIREAKEEMQRFIQTVYKKEKNQSTEICSITNDNMLVFSETHNTFKVFNKHEYKNLQIDKRL